MEKELFDDLIQGCNEIIAHQKGEIKLKSTILTIPDTEIEKETVDKFYKLSDQNKQKATVYINELYKKSIAN